MTRIEAICQLVEDMRTEAEKMLAGSISVEMDGNRISMHTSNATTKVYNIDPPRPIPPRGTAVMQPGTMTLAWSCGCISSQGHLYISDNFYLSNRAGAKEAWPDWIVFREERNEKQTND